MMRPPFSFTGIPMPLPTDNAPSFVNDLLASVHLAQEETEALRDSRVNTSAERDLIGLTRSTLALLESLISDQAQVFNPNAVVDGQVDPTAYPQLAALVKVAAEADPTLKPMARELSERYVGLASAKRQSRNQAFKKIAHVGPSLDGRRTTEAMIEALVAYRESEEGWREIKDKRTSTLASSTHPLLAWLGSPHLSSAVRAEALAHVELYVRSGHAEQDFNPDHLPENVKEQQTVLALRALADRLAAGEIVSEDALGQAIEQRFSQVFIQARLKADRGDGLYSLDLFKAGQPFSFASLPKSGEVGALIRDAKAPEKLWLGCTTSSTDTRWEGDQLPRFVAAVRHACERGDPAVRPIMKAGRELKSELSQVWFFSSALYPDVAQKQALGRERLYALAQQPTRSGGRIPWNQELLHQIRSLGLWRLMDADTERFGQPAGWLNANHAAIGGHSAWQPGPCDLGRDGEQAKSLASEITQVLHFVGALTRIPTPDKPWGAHHRDADMVGNLCSLVQQASVGLFRHFSGHPGVAETLLGAERDMRHIRDFRMEHQSVKEVEQWNHLLRDLKDRLEPDDQAPSPHPARRRSP